VTGFSFRPATVSDLDPLLALEARCFPRPWPRGAFEQELELPHAALWLAFEREVLAGYVDFWVVPPEISLLNVAVDPAFQRRGLGRAFLELMEREGAAAGGEEVYLEVRRTNLGAQALYESVGYVQTGIRKRYYSDTGEDAILMGKRLADGS
jgi:ribosomal-protein-alanine N-acetyltransferase